ncbi:MAG: competence protein ComEA [Chloroflexi bacterium]|jgi:competence protein ComEA|nr:MAG: competence protein ComEA [Chloroflexota bacterium]
MVAVALAGIGLLATRSDRPPGIEIFLPTPTATPELAAYITGAVVSPGVYTIDIESRIADLIRAAGGETTDADLNSINLS